MTAAVIEGDTELTTFEDLTFDQPPACDGATATDDVCPFVAEYQVHVACCGTVLLYCEDCFLYVMEGIKHLAPNIHTCAICSAVIVDPANHVIFDGRL